MWKRKEREDFRVIFKFPPLDWSGCTPFRAIVMLTVMTAGQGWNLLEGGLKGTHRTATYVWHFGINSPGHSQWLRGLRSIFGISLIQIPDTLVGKLWTKWLKMEAWGTSTLKGCHRAGERTLMKKKWLKEEPGIRYHQIQEISRKKETVWDEAECSRKIRTAKHPLVSVWWLVLTLAKAILEALSS